MSARAVYGGVDLRLFFVIARMKGLRIISEHPDSVNILTHSGNIVNVCGNFFVLFFIIKMLKVN